MKVFKIFTVIISTLVLFLVATPSRTALAGPADRWLHGATGYARALELQRELKVPLVVYFYTDWCPYCQALDNDYLTAAPVQQYLRGVVKVRINPELGPAEEDIAGQYSVRGYPAFFIIREPNSMPRKVHPFRRGKNLTPAEFAKACEQAASSSTPAAIPKAPPTITKAPATGTTTSSGSVNSAIRQTAKSQMIEVPRSSAAPTTDAELPTVDAILDKYVAAIGGREAQRKITTRVTRGRVDVPGVSFGGKVEVYAKAPNKSLTVMNVEPMGLFKHGFDGRTSWNLSDNGLNVSSVIDREAILDADFYRDIRLKELYTRLKVTGKVKEGFRHVYVVEATPRGGTAENFYFDVDTGLLVRRDLTRPGAKGPVRAEVYFSDWRELDGVKIPFKMTHAMPTVKLVTTIEEVKHNVPVDDALFRRPQ